MPITSETPAADPFPAAEPELPANLEGLVQRSIELRREQRDLKDRMDRNAAELKRLDPALIEQFGRLGIRSQKMISGETTYIERTLHASLVPDDDGEHRQAHAALRRHGLEWLVQDRVNAQSLSAWVREQEKLEAELPPELETFIRRSEVYRVKVRL